MGSPSVVGTKMGWTVDDLNAAFKKMPEGSTIFDETMTRPDILNTCLSMDLDDYVNWTTGECSFDKGGFQKLLEFANSFPSDFDWKNYDWEDYKDPSIRIAAGKQMLMQAYIGQLSNYSMKAAYEEYSAYLDSDGEPLATGDKVPDKAPDNDVSNPSGYKMGEMAQAYAAITTAQSKVNSAQNAYNSAQNAYSNSVSSSTSGNYSLKVASDKANMNQGVIQQVGTPQEVFDHPSNMFVAGFIGTPQMNFIDCVLTIRDGAVWAKAGDNFVALPHFAAFDGGAEEGRRVVLGIRPEYVTVGGKEGLPAVVTLKELTGSSVQLHLKLGEGEIIVVVPVTMC